MTSTELSHRTENSALSREKYEELKKAAQKERIDQALEQDQTGNDPRVMAHKWLPFYRYTELENGLTQQDMTAFREEAASYDTDGSVYFQPRSHYG